MAPCAPLPTPLAKLISPLQHELGKAFARAARDTPTIIVDDPAQDLTAALPMVFQGASPVAIGSGVARTLSLKPAPSMPCQDHPPRHVILLASVDLCLSHHALPSPDAWPLLWIHEVAHVALFRAMPHLPEMLATQVDEMNDTILLDLLALRGDLLRNWPTHRPDHSVDAQTAWQRVQSLLTDHLGGLALPFLWQETSEGLSRLAELRAIRPLGLGVEQAPWLFREISDFGPQNSHYETGLALCRVLVNLQGPAFLHIGHPLTQPLATQLSDLVLRGAASDHGDQR